MKLIQKTKKNKLLITYRAHALIKEDRVNDNSITTDSCQRNRNVHDVHHDLDRIGIIKSCYQSVVVITEECVTYVKK